MASQPGSQIAPRPSTGLVRQPYSLPMRSEDGTQDARFRNPRGLRLWSFAGEILVRCPRCDARASIRPEPQPEDAKLFRPWTPRRLACLSCGFTDHWTMPRSADDLYGIPPEFTGPDDPYFHLPLWLSTECRGHILWAYNTQHLDLLEAYVSARLRERSHIPDGMSLVEQLPAWIKDGRHRSEIMNGIRRLRATAA